MSKKKIEEVKVDTDELADVIRAIEYAILPVFIVFCIFSLKVATVIAALGGIVVSAMCLINAFVKHNKSLKK